MIEKSKIIEILKSEDYPEFMYENTYNKITRFHESIAKAFISWLNYHVTPDIMIEGYSYDVLTNQMNMKPVGTFITLDWLIRDPKKAKQALKRGIK